MRPSPRALEERAQVEERDEADRHAQHRERAHADPPPEEFVERDEVHDASSRGSLRNTTVSGSRPLCQYVTTASRYAVSLSRGVLAAT